MKTGESNIIEKYKQNKHQLAAKMHPRYLEVFEYCTGITDGILHTQKEAGKKFGVSSTRIAQLVARVKYELEQLEK